MGSTPYPKELYFSGVQFLGVRGTHPRPSSEGGGVTIIPQSRIRGPSQGLDSALLNELCDGPLSRSEIAQRLGHKRISGVVNRLIRRLMISGRIVRTLPEKPNSRLQKYRKV